MCTIVFLICFKTLFATKLTNWVVRLTCCVAFVLAMNTHSFNCSLNFSSVLFLFVVVVVWVFCVQKIVCVQVKIEVCCWNISTHSNCTAISELLCCFLIFTLSYGNHESKLYCWFNNVEMECKKKCENLNYLTLMIEDFFRTFSVDESMNMIEKYFIHLNPLMVCANYKIAILLWVSEVDEQMPFFGICEQGNVFFILKMRIP